MNEISHTGAPGTRQNHPSRKSLRQATRQRRRSLSRAEQHKAAQKLFLRLANHPLIVNARRAAFYLPNDGEISPLWLMCRAMQRGTQCYLPRVADDNQLEFRRYQPMQPLRNNAFGIPEPDRRNQGLAAQKLDLVFMPLVAFDSRGNRLGMGGGYYDRAFEFRLKNRKTPTIIGLAHDCQRVDRLVSQAWDVPLDFIATADNWIKASN